MPDSESHSYQPSLDQSALLYGAEYYRNCCGPIPYERSSHWLTFFGAIVDEIIRSLRPKNVFDAGCAWGFLVESFLDRGVEAHGSDISSYAISNVRPDLKTYCSVTSLTEPISGSYDLITCIEVLEHMPEDQARVAILRMIEATDRIIFSSTPDNFDEPTHINVHPAIYWLKLFSEFHFYPDVLFDASFIAPHAFLVRRSSTATPEDVLLLFAEVLRYRGQRAAFLSRHNRIEELEKEVPTLTSQLEGARRDVIGLRSSLSGEIELRRECEVRIERLEKEVQTLASQLEEATRDVAGLRSSLSGEFELRREGEVRSAKLQWDLTTTQQHFADIQAELGHARNSLRMTNEARAQLETLYGQEEARWRVQLEESALTGREAAQLAAELQARLDDSKLQTARSEFILDEWMRRNAELSQDLDLVSQHCEDLRADLEYVYNSPGWRFILRYRAWLQTGLRRHLLIRNVLEPTARWTLRQMNLPPKTESARMLVAPGTSHDGSHSLSHERLSPTASSTPDINPSISQPKEELTDYETWIRENEPNAVQLAIQRKMSACFSYRPKISVIVPVFKVPVAVIQEMIESVVAQTYDNWQLCVAIPVNDNPAAWIYLEEVAKQDPRIHLKPLTANEGIAGNSNEALTIATGDYLALLDHDDTLASFALFEVVQLLNHDRTINFIYSDKDLISEDGQRRLLPLFKPDWSPELMLNANYVTHLCVLRTEHVRQVGGWRKQTDGAQDWDLFLRAIDRFGNVRRISKVLYHWRQISTSVSSGGPSAKPYAAQGQVRAVSEHCNGKGLQASVTFDEQAGLRIGWHAQPGEKISIICLSSNPDDETLAYASKLAELTDHPDFEILVPLAGEDGRDGFVRRIKAHASASLLDRINSAVSAASGGTLVFIDQCVVPAGRDWLREIIGPLQLPSVGIVGARLLDANLGTLRHCGIVFTNEGHYEYIYAGQPDHVYEQFGGAGWYRNWSAVSGACFAIRRSVWNEVDGMSGESLHSRLDIHLSLSLRLLTNRRIVYNPYARLMQNGRAAIETFSFGDSRLAGERFRASFPDGDPYFNPNLDCRKGKVIYRLRQRESGTPRGSDYSAESRALVNAYDFAPGQVELSRQATFKAGKKSLESITWFLPDFVNPFYGGIHTILRFADVFRRQGVKSNFCIIGHSSEGCVRRQIAAAFPELAKASRIFVLTGNEEVKKLPSTTAAVCSLWTTAYAALNFNQTRQKFYFIQDDETLFYPAGSTSAMVDATYEFGFHGICNTVSLLDRYAARGGKGEYFNPCIDPGVFHSLDRKELAGALPYTLFCYGRPNHSRNCFELLAATLRILKKRLDDRLLIITAGADWDLHAHQLDGIVQNLGLLNYQATGALYRICDAGLVLMMTRHPSYLPMELMGCGSLVITNRNPDTGWLLKDNENCLLADSSASSLAERVEEGLKNIPMRQRITAHAQHSVGASYSDWEAQIQKIYRYMLEQC